MKYTQFIEEAIYTLFEQGCERKNLIICYPKLMDHYLLHEIGESFRSNIDIEHSTYFKGVEINKFWPYNEIVVYDKENCPRHPHLIVKGSILKINEDKK